MTSTPTLDTAHATCRYGPHTIRRGALSTDGPWYADVLGGGDGIDCGRSPTGLHAPADGMSEVEALRSEVARLNGVVADRSRELGEARHREEFSRGEHQVTLERNAQLWRELGEAVGDKAEVARLRDNYKVAWEAVALDRQNIADQLYASCICDPNPETTEGMLEDCPVHGTDEHRPLALLKRIEQAEAELEQYRVRLAARITGEAGLSWQELLDCAERLAEANAEVRKICEYAYRKDKNELAGAVLDELAAALAPPSAPRAPARDSKWTTPPDRERP